jgi:hypothetical protein
MKIARFQNGNVGREAGIPPPPRYSENIELEENIRKSSGL